MCQLNEKILLCKCLDVKVSYTQTLDNMFEFKNRSAVLGGQSNINVNVYET